MALFKTIADVKLYWPTMSSGRIENLLPFITQAERDFIIPAISKAQYDNLSTWYNVASPASSQANEGLLMKVQAALALYAYFLWVPSGQLQIGDSGIRIATSEFLKTAFQWQIDDLRTSILNQAGSATEDLLEFMETNKVDYEPWTLSTSYTIYKDCFITSAAKFTEYYNALGNSRLNFLAVRGQMKKVEDFILQSELSPAFYSELREQYLDDDLTAANTLLIPMIQKAVANLTMSCAFAQLVVGISENGILNFNSTASRIPSKPKQPAKDLQITKLEMQAEKDGRAYMLILKEYLSANIANYTTYAASAAYNSTTTDTAFENDSDQTYVFMG